MDNRAQYPRQYGNPQQRNAGQRGYEGDQGGYHQQAYEDSRRESPDQWREDRDYRRENRGYRQQEGYQQNPGYPDDQEFAGHGRGEQYQGADFGNYPYADDVDPARYYRQGGQQGGYLQGAGQQRYRGGDRPRLPLGSERWGRASDWREPARDDNDYSRGRFFTGSQLWDNENFSRGGIGLGYRQPQGSSPVWQNEPSPRHDDDYFLNNEGGLGGGVRERAYESAWQGQGRGEQQGHRGRGPKGYERSDERIKEDICERLADDPQIDASEIAVTVKSGVVTLEGTIDNRRLKHRVEDMADNCGGVKDVQNRLNVNRPGGPMTGSTGGTHAGAQASAAASSPSGSQGRSRGGSGDDHTATRQ